MDSGYSGSAVALAVVTSIFVPWLALVVALVALGDQSDPARRRQLRSWAWGSGLWFVTATALAVLLAFA